MVANPFRSHQIATGGEENDLKIWDLQNRSEPVFKAKNVNLFLSYTHSGIMSIPVITVKH